MRPNLRAIYQEAILSQYRVRGLLDVQIQEEVREQPVRAYRGQLSSVRKHGRFQLPVSRVERDIEEAISLLGWRVSATNQASASLGLPQTVEAYRDAYLVERNFGRLKGHPLAPAPLYVQRDDHRIGLVRLLTIALRVLTVLEGVVRHSP